eukprot:CAMPEP_0201608814 /NCGR_PEP_ID=MMETSP0492-20130828/9037_1 /ASSEMBLY_ACC=CAM_ASM_000837 /TAXON_ID=420259 /ORGANISM="Thalassiosira gravida, Strain GMp14c1" /LENGTH=113 /DNA_ID=CAMNT_0048073803 /DNA_START=69 /DNA_END=409 /DNA_ORIENTATION=+
MNNTALLSTAVVIVSLLLSSSTTIAFSPSATTARRPTSLHSIVFEPPVEENCEIDGSVGEKNDADDAIKDRYRLQGIELSSVDLMDSMDQYNNAPTGGGIIPGMNLSALCEDD